MTQDRLRDTASCIVSQGALAFHEPTGDIALNGARHRRDFIGFGQHRASIARVLHEPILPPVATHLDMRDNVDPQMRDVALAHATVKQFDIVGNFLEHGIERLVQQFESRNVRIAHVDNDAGAFRCFDARLAHGILQRLWRLRSLVLIFFLSPHDR